MSQDLLQVFRTTCLFGGGYQKLRGGSAKAEASPKEGGPFLATPFVHAMLARCPRRSPRHPFHSSWTQVCPRPPHCPPLSRLASCSTACSSLNVCTRPWTLLIISHLPGRPRPTAGNSGQEFLSNVPCLAPSPILQFFVFESLCLGAFVVGLGRTNQEQSGPIRTNPNINWVGR